MPNYDLGTARGRIVVDSSTLGRSTSALDKMAKSMLAVGALGAIGFGFAIKAAADFEEQLSRFKAVTNTPNAEMDKLSAKALQLGRDSAYGATEVIKSFVELGKSGASATDILAGLGDATVYLAAAGEIPLADASIVLVNALKQFRLPASQAVHVADLLAGAANASTSEVDDLAASLRYAGPVAAFAGVSIEDTATALALFANAGIKGSAAGTAMRALLLGIAGTTPKATKTLKELGIITQDGVNHFYNLDGTLRPLPEVFQTLGDAMRGMTPHEKTVALNAIFLRRGLVAAALAATSGKKDFEALRKEVEKTTAHDVMKKKLDNLKGSVKILGASLETFAITIGEQFTPALKSAADFLRELTNRLAKLTPEQRRILSYVLLGVVAFFLFGGALSFVISRVLKAYRAFRDLGTAIRLSGAVLGRYSGISYTAGKAVAKLRSALESLYLVWLDTAAGEALAAAPLWAIIAVMILVAAAAYLLWTNWDKVWNWIMKHKAYAIILALLFPFIAFFVAIIGGLKWLYDHWDQIWAAIQQAASDVVDWLSTAWGDVQGAFNDVVNWVGQAVDDIIKWFKKLPENASKAVDDTLNWLQHLPETLATLAGDAIHWLATTGVNIIVGLLNGMAQQLPAITDFLLSLPGTFITLFADAGSWLLGPGSEMLFGFLQGMGNMIGNVLGWIVGTFIPGVLNFFAAASSWLLQAGWDVLLGFWRGALNLVGAVMGWFGGFSASILRAVGDLGGTLVGSGAAAIQGLFNGAIVVFSTLGSWLGAMPVKIINFIGDLGGTLVDAGRALMEGLLNGIRAAFNAVKDFVSGIADTIASIKGPLDYDKVLLVKNGQLIMAGLLRGLKDGWPAVKDLMQSYTDMIGAPISGSVALSAAGTAAIGTGRDAGGAVQSTGISGGGRSVTQYVTIDALDARQAAMAVESERIWAERTSGVA